MFDNRIGMVKTLPALPGDSGKSVSGCRLRKDGQLAASISLVEALGGRAFPSDQGCAMATFLAAAIGSRVGHSTGVNSASRWISVA